MTTPFGVDGAVRVARAGLSAVGDTEAGRPLTRLVRAAGPVEAWGLLRAPTAAVRSSTTLSGLARRAAAVEPDAALAAWTSAGGRFVVPGDPEWPPALTDLEPAIPAPGDPTLDPATPCLGLWAVGPLELGPAVRQAVGIVGSRAATRYGLDVARELAAGLALRGWSVVSGAAYGVDAAAHRGALSVGGGTVAVLACGADLDYPAGHAGLLEQFRTQGLVVSEVPPGVPPTRSRFLHRNRLVAALSAGVVMVEAGLRSGARSTLGRAEALGRVCMVVPGPVTSALSAGCHRALRELPTARLVTGSDEVIEEVGRFGVDLAPRPAGPQTWRDDLGTEAREVLDAFPGRGALDLDELIDRTGLPVPAVRVAVDDLARAGLVRGDADGRWSLAPRALADTRAARAADRQEVLPLG